jgi:hypothetical protein
MVRLTCLVGAVMLTTLLFASMAVAQDLKNCGDFPSQEAAQKELRRDPTDPHRLDGNDDDGIACENNPAPFDRTPVQKAIGDGGGQPRGGGKPTLLEAGGDLTLPDTGGPALLQLAAVGLGAGLLGVCLLRR